MAQTLLYVSAGIPASGRMNTTVSLSVLATVTAIQTGRFLRPSVSPAICSGFQRKGCRKTSPAADQFIRLLQVPLEPFNHQRLEILGHFVDYVDLLGGPTRELLILIPAHQDELRLAVFGDRDRPEAGGRASVRDPQCLRHDRFGEQSFDPFNLTSTRTVVASIRSKRSRYSWRTSSGLALSDAASSYGKLWAELCKSQHTDHDNAAILNIFKTTKMLQ